MGRGAEHRAELGGGIQGKQALKAATFLLSIPDPSCPQVDDSTFQAWAPGSISQRETCQGGEQSPMLCSATGESSSGIPLGPPSKTAQGHAWVLKWDAVFISFIPSCHKMPFHCSLAN